MKYYIFLCFLLVMSVATQTMDANKKTLFKSFGSGLHPTATRVYSDRRLCEVSTDGRWVVIRPSLCAGRYMHVIDRKKNTLHAIQPKGFKYITALTFDDNNNLYVGDDVGTIAMLKKSDNWKAYSTSTKSSITFLRLSTIDKKAYLVAGTKVGMKVWERSSDHFGFPKDILRSEKGMTCGAWGNGSIFTFPHVYAGSGNGLVIWKPQLSSLSSSSIGGKRVHWVDEKMCPITALSVTSNDALITGHEDGCCRIWDTKKVIPTVIIVRKLMPPLPLNFVYLHNEKMVLMSFISQVQNQTILRRCYTDSSDGSQSTALQEDAASTFVFDEKNRHLICASANNAITTFEHLDHK